MNYNNILAVNRRIVNISLSEVSNEFGETIK